MKNVRKKNRIMPGNLFRFFAVMTGTAMAFPFFCLHLNAMPLRFLSNSLIDIIQETPKLKQKDQTPMSLKKKDQPKKTESDDDFDDFDEDETSLGFQFIFNGFVELENFVNTYVHQEPEDVFKKNEFRVRLSMQLGNENYYFKCVPNFYFLPFFLSEGLYDDYHYSESDFTLARNGRMSGEYYELSFNECFLNLGFKHFRVRLGNQLYAWGTADVFNPTSFINPTDSRELFYKDADENKLGVPSLSSMIFLSDFTLEFVFVPFHIGAISPESDNFWAYHYKRGYFLEVEEEKYQALPPAGENLGYGVRCSGSVKGVDFSVSLYQGPDVNPMLRPVDYLETTSNIKVKQTYYTSTNLGWDLSFKLWKFEFHAEMAYSPNKYGVVDEEKKHSDGIDMKWPWPVKQSHYISYAVGFNFIWNDLIFTAEWLQSDYTDESLMEPFYTYFVSMSLSYTFFDELLKLSLVTVCDVKNIGYLLFPSVSFDFHNGVSLRLAYSHIGSTETDDINVFTLFKKHDILILGVRYEF